MGEHRVTQTTVFKSNRTQAVRLPRDVALPEDVKQVDILRVGGARLIVPSGRRWDDFFAGPAVSDDFMREREQPPAQERDPI
jgi:antitoxin VapB